MKCLAFNNGLLLLLVIMMMMTTISTIRSEVTCFNKRKITMKFKSSAMGQTCDGEAACFSKQNTRLETNFDVPKDPWTDFDLSKYYVLATSGSLRATVSSVFNPCLSDSSNLNSTSSFSINGQPVYIGRKNLGKDFVTYKCISRGSCSETFSATSSDEEYPYSGFLNLTSSGNTAVLEYSDPSTDLCVYSLDFTFCYMSKNYIIYDLRLQVDDITTKPLKIISPKTMESLKQDVLIPQSYDPLQNGYSDKFTRKIKITNKLIVQTGLNLFNLKIFPNNANFKDPLVVDIISITKEKTIDGSIISQDISGKYQISNRSLSDYNIKFNTSLSVDEIITVQLTLGVNGEITSSVYDMNMNYRIETIDENTYNLQDTTIMDGVYYFRRSDITATYDTNQKIAAKSLVSDMVSLEYVSESEEDGKCYLQVNTLYGSSSDKFSGLLFIYSSKTGKQYSMKFGQDYTLDKSTKQIGQYIIPPELLDCSSVGVKTNIYFKWVVLSSNSYTTTEPSANFQIAISKKSIIFVNDLANANIELTFSQRYESNVILLKSNPPNMIVPYDVILKNSYSSSASPFASYLSYSVPLSWLDNSPMNLNPVSYPQLSTDFSASEIYLKTGMYFGFIEKSCSVLPCKSSINFQLNSQLANPQSIAVDTTIKVSQSGYRSSGYITAVSIPSSLARAASSSKFNLRVLAEVKETYYNSYSTKNPYYLQVSKGSVGMTQNPPYNSTFGQQIASQNYLTTDKCASTSSTGYLTVNIPIRDESDYGTWYIAFFVDPNSSFDVKYTINLMSNIIPLKLSTTSSKAALTYTPISSVIYGLQFSSETNSDSSLLLTFDGYSLETNSFEGSGIQVFLKHGSMPTENDYDVLSPVLTGSLSFIARFVYSDKVTFRYLMDNSYYSDPAERIKYPEDYYKTSILSNSKLDSSTLYVLIKRVPSGQGYTNCVSSSYIVSPSSSYIAYQYSSSPSVVGGYLEKMKSQVISVNPDVIGANLAISNGNQLMIDFNQETIIPNYASKPTIVSYDGKKLEILVDQNSTINSDSISVSAYTFKYYIWGKSGQTPTVSFRYSINAKLSVDEKSGKYSQQVFIVFPVKSGYVTQDSPYDTIVRINSRYQPSTYLIESLTPSIIATAIVVGISFIMSCIYFVWSVFIVVVKRGEFNFGTVSPQMWLGCLCPASLPVSICYFYYFAHEGFQQKLASPPVKRRRRTRILIALSIISFTIGVLFGLYLYGHVAFNHLGLELSAHFNLYTLGKRTTDSTYSSSNLIPCCAQTRTGTSKDKQFRTYFGVESSTFTPKFSGGRLDCIKDLDSIVRDALRSKFVLDEINGQKYEPPTDSAIQKTSYGYSNAFQMATVYCVGNSVVLMKADDSYNEYGIPGAFLSVFPILYSFYLIILVIFEKIFGDGRKLSESNNDQIGRTTLLLGNNTGYEPNTNEASYNPNIQSTEQ
ncbi:hypothetical protein NAEGRDRAFT_79031 [Naegleria gruberi]|uniref:Uncharacterized protein n=1 Tax=Naegleria gruberi TaxID=5762 RepID=D2V8R8_NAEGR|nr:uncharacterized protein NAEGRDRAFT_79031 [Naegleria gruberi]EFC46737.1 hypothetical protein NAEGRDRAFT_79031 [Naegleria gruberi]|eukprot:XP_002679481.1 hypothetical protein NAEGRDRAFT_79031 [Naegleria gruberi strain NEG-M]